MKGQLVKVMGPICLAHYIENRWIQNFDYNGNTYGKWRLGCLLDTFPMMSRVKVKAMSMILGCNVSKYTVRDRDSFPKDHQ